MTRSHEYFASIVDKDDFGRALASKIKEYRDAPAVRAVHERIEKAYQYHFGLSPGGIHLTSGVTRGGEAGELAEVRVNHIRANALTVLNLTVAPKICWKPVATNADSRATKAAYNAEALLEYYWLAREVGHFAIQAVAHAIPLTEGFVFTPWEESAGETVAVGPDGAPQLSGDFAIYNVLPWDVIRDPSKRSWDENRWIAVCLWLNRYEVAAKHPDQAEKILNCSTDNEDDRDKAFGRSDDIPVWHFFHKPSPIAELQKGREAKVLQDGTVLSDGALTYDAIPLHRVVPDEQFGTPYGYSQYHEGMGIQEATDSLTSAILTNQDAFARQMIAVKAGENFAPENFAGMTVLPYNMEKPSALQLTASPAEAFKFVDVLKSDLQRVQGVNDAVQGQLPGDAKLSGAALALLSSQAIQQNSTLQTNYVRMVRSIGNCILNEWKKRTPLPRKIQLVGKTNEFLCREQSLSGSDIAEIKEVTVDIGNPLQQTHAGKMELAQMFLQTPGAVTSPEQIIQITTTGKIEHLTKGKRDEEILVLDENESIAEGIPPPVMMQDDHLFHGREHRSTLASVAARSNPKIVAASIAHLHEHYCVYFGWTAPPPIIDPMTGLPGPELPADPTMDPMYRQNMALLTGVQPPPMMGLPPGAPGAPPPAGPPLGTAPETKPTENVMAPPEPAGNQTNLPGMPRNPATGAEYVPPGGQ